MTSPENSTVCATSYSGLQQINVKAPHHLPFVRESTERPCHYAIMIYAVYISWMKLKINLTLTHNIELWVNVKLIFNFILTHTAFYWIVWLNIYCYARALIQKVTTLYYIGIFTMRHSLDNVNLYQTILSSYPIAIRIHIPQHSIHPKGIIFIGN